MENEGYISVQQAQDILRVSTRQVQYHAANGKLTSRKVGRRLEVLEEDVHHLAEELGAGKKPPPQPSVEMLPDTGPLIDYIRDLTAQLNSASRRIGHLEGQLEAQTLRLEDEQHIKSELEKAKTEARALEEKNRELIDELAKERSKGFWDKLFG